MEKLPKTALAYLVESQGVKQVELAAVINTSKQQINKLMSGERIMTPKWAKLLAPRLGVDWTFLVEGKAPDESAAVVELGVGIWQGRPLTPHFVDDPDKLALLRLWDELSFVKRASLFAHLGMDDMPSAPKSK